MNQEEEYVDYTPLIPEIVKDMNYVLASAVSKEIKCAYYCVAVDDTDNAISVIFLDEIDEQTSFLSQLEGVILNNIDHNNLIGPTHVELLKPIAGMNAHALMAAFPIE